MSQEFKLSSKFPFASGQQTQFSCLGPKNVTIQVEAPTQLVAREVGHGIASAMEDCPCSAAKIAAIDYINQANERQMPLSCTLRCDVS